MSKEKVIEIARGELGEHENPPGSNRVKYWQDYDPAYQGQPWCVCFLWWVFQQAGERMAFFGGGKTASCGVLLRWYKEQGLTVPVGDVQMGDIVLLNFNGKGTPDHCGLVVEVTHSEDERPDPLNIITIEGNTTMGNGSQDNGGRVCEKVRYDYQIVAVCRPQYKQEEPMKDDITGHWAEDVIKWALRTGLIKGYSDGTVRPDDHLTRAELVTILKRYDNYRFGGSEKTN